MGSTLVPLGVFTGSVLTDSASDIATFDSSIASFSALMGASPTFSDTGPDWTQPVSDWLSNTQWEASSWQASPIASTFTPVIGLPMASSAAGSETADQMFLDFIAGTYDSMLNQMVQAWAAAGFTTQYWKPGWEMNLIWEQPWSAGDNPQYQADYVAAFQHIYTVLHEAGTEYGVNVQVVWAPCVVSWGTINPTTALYPGSQYVDSIGADVYSGMFPLTLYDFATGVVDSTFGQWASNPINLEHYWTYPGANGTTNDATSGRALSLQQVINFAQAQGKSLSIDETGSGSGSNVDISNDPLFPQWLAQTLAMAGVPILYAVLWDTGSYSFSGPGELQPALAASWAEYFGAASNSIFSAGLSGTVVDNGVLMAGVAVAVLNSYGIVIGTTTTNSAGAFSFTSLAVGTYQLKYTAPTGLVLQTGSVANSANGLTAPITLAASQTVNLAAQLLLSQPSGIREVVRHYGGPTDPATGSNDPGVTVTLLNSAGVAIASAVTDVNGFVSFSQLAAGVYRLQYTPPAGQEVEPGTPSTSAQITLAAGVWVNAPSGSMVSAVTMTGTSVKVAETPGSYYVSGDASESSLTLGVGNQNVVLSGTANTVTTGNGNQTISLAGRSNTIKIGTGTSTIFAGGGDDSVTAGGGSVTISASGAGNSFDSGPGVALFQADGSAGNVFVLNHAGGGNLTTINGFSLAAHDILDLKRTLAASRVTANLANIGNFLSSAVTDAGTVLYAYSPGSHGTMTQFAVLSGVQTSVAALQANKSFSLA